MNSTKSYIINLVLDVLCEIQHKDYQLYELRDNELYEEHKILARANMCAIPVPVESLPLEGQLLAKTHELAMALVTEIKHRFSGHSDLFLCGTSPHFDLW